jgi:hypothetical protein
MDSRDWSDIAYNFLVCPHGYIFEGRGLNVINGANGTNTANQNSHAICMLAGEGNDFPDVEKQAFRECVRYISAHTKAPDQCVGHRDHKSTACPGDVRYNWIHQGMPVSTTTPQVQGEEDMKHFRPIVAATHPDVGKTFLVVGNIRFHVPSQSYHDQLVQEGYPADEVNAWAWDCIRAATFGSPDELIERIANKTEGNVQDDFQKLLDGLKDIIVRELTPAASSGEGASVAEIEAAVIKGITETGLIGLLPGK